MKQRYHIEFDPELPERETIRKHQDFDALLAAYEDQPKPTRPTPVLWTISTMLAIAAAIVGVVFIWNNLFFNIERRYQQQATYFFENTSPSRTFDTAKPQLVSQTVTVQNDSSLQLNDQLSITFDGKAAGEELTFVYRTLLDPFDYFTANVPMKFDTLNNQYLNTSAGMLEIYAERAGQRITVEENTSWNAQFVLNTGANQFDNYHLYRFNEAIQNWEYQQTVPVQLVQQNKQAIIEKINTLAAEQAQQLAALEQQYALPDAPVQPKPTAADRTTLSLDFLKSFATSETAQELSEKYDGAIWQLTAESNPIPADLGNALQNATIDPLENNVYKVVLFAEDQTVELLVEPVYTNIPERLIEDYEVAKAAYEVEKEKITTEKAAAIRQVEQAYAQKIANAKAQAAAGNSLAVVEFQLTDFGLWSFQKAEAMPEEKALVQFKDEDGIVLEGKTGYLLNTTDQTLQKIYVDTKTVLQFDAAANYQFWIVEEGNTILQLSSQAFQAIEPSKKLQTITLERKTVNWSDEEAARQVLTL